MAIKHQNNKFTVDIQPGGRLGKRIRKTFVKLSLAKEFERRHMIDTQSMGIADLTFSELVDLYWDQYASLRFVGSKTEFYRLRLIKSLIKDTQLKALQLNHGEEFLIKRKERGMTIGTINRDINSLKRVTSWAVEHNYLRLDPFKNLKHLKGNVSRIRWLNQEEIKELLRACERLNDLDLKDIILLGVNTGFRRGNIKDLKWEDIKGDMILAKKTKTGVPYEVPMNETLKEVLNRLPRNTEYIVDVTNLRRRFKEALKEAKLLRSSDDEEKVTLHTLRHTFASRYLQAGVPIYTVARWLGHASVVMTERVYGHLCNHHHLEEVKKLKGIGE
jgi:integrase